ncbi:hypothetical protein Rhopal_004794-T1 [Rhodotorula paludigena]|uniref:Uncharacterized protein n=1 Tax=Rhodotorula paludigena TaxID=86838 RepID=A0AAV5GGR3_9BASI|nr:hypothetical protein Rhopal_004794-T1 [Rhodotorula paludigena]
MLCLQLLQVALPGVVPDGRSARPSGKGKGKAKTTGAIPAETLAILPTFERAIPPQVPIVVFLLACSWWSRRPYLAQRRDASNLRLCAAAIDWVVFTGKLELHVLPHGGRLVTHVVQRVLIGQGTMAGALRSLFQLKWSDYGSIHALACRSTPVGVSPGPAPPDVVMCAVRAWPFSSPTVSSFERALAVALGFACTAGACRAYTFGAAVRFALPLGGSEADGGSRANVTSVTVECALCGKKRIVVGSGVVYVAEEALTRALSYTVLSGPPRNATTGSGTVEVHYKMFRLAGTGPSALVLSTNHVSVEAHPHPARKAGLWRQQRRQKR